MVCEMGTGSVSMPLVASFRAVPGVLPAGLLVHLQHGLVRVDHLLPEQFSQEGIAEGFQVELGSLDHPVRHSVAFQVHTQSLPHLFLSVQRQRVSELFHNDVRDDGG